MEQAWFEMAPERARRLETAAWIPLRADQTLLSTGESGHLGFTDDYFGVGSVAVATLHKAQAESLRWPDVGLARTHSPSFENEQYVSADAGESYGEDFPGLPLVLAQRGNGESPDQWHLHQDLVIALGLIREGDRWLAMNEGYAEVARLRRRGDGSPTLLEVRAEHLKDYLCARGMALYVTSYRRREEVVEDAKHILWADTTRSAS
jgi:hypothetical protein